MPIFALLLVGPEQCDPVRVAFVFAGGFELVATLVALLGELVPFPVAEHEHINDDNHEPSGAGLDERLDQAE
jgi:hypothetical protein